MRLGPYEILAAIGAGGMGKSTEPATRGSHATLPSKFFHSCLRPIHPHWRDSNAKPRCDRQAFNQFWRVSLTRDDRRIAVVADEVEGNLWTIRDQ